MPWRDTDAVNADNLNKKSGLVFDIRDDEFGAFSSDPETDRPHDSTDAIQSAITMASDTIGRVRITQGNYFISKPLRINNNCTIEWDCGAKIIATKNFKGGNATSNIAGMLELFGSERVCLINPQLDGNRHKYEGAHAADHPPAPGFVGIIGLSAIDVQIVGGTIESMPGQVDPVHPPRPGTQGDGVFLGDSGDPSKGIPFVACNSWRVTGTLIRNCFRNGVTLDSATECVIEGLILRDNGYVGLDIELQNTSRRLNGLIVRNCQASHNGFAGISLGSNFEVTVSNSAGSIVLMGNSLEFNKGLKVSGTGDSGAALAINKWRRVQVIGNIIRHTAGELGISVSSSKNISFIGNIVEDLTPISPENTDPTEVTSTGNLGLPNNP